jgi:cell wall-associated NlpC family hydrolase
MITPFHPTLKDGIVYRDQWEMASRERVVAEARTWIGTPYHLGGRVKGAGCDCYTFIAETMTVCEIIRGETLPIYAGDWWAHISDEQYLRRLMRYATKVFEGVGYGNTDVKPGNILAVRAAGTQSRVFNHGAIVTNWPKAIHSVDEGVEECDVTSHHMWSFQPIRVFDPWEKPNAER